MVLQIQPPTRPSAKIARQPQGGVRRDAALPAHDLADSDRRHGERPGQRILAEFQRLHEVVEQDFAGMNRLEFLGLHKVKLKLPDKAVVGLFK